MKIKVKRENRIRRHRRVRAAIKGTSDRPRVSIFKSNRNIFVQFINDETGKTVLSSQIEKAKGKGQKANRREGPVRSRVSVETKTNRAVKIGEVLAEKAKEAGIKEVVFDRGGFKYHGRVKAVADGLRKGGIKF